MKCGLKLSNPYWKQMTEFFVLSLRSVLGCCGVGVLIFGCSPCDSTCFNFGWI